MLSSSRPSWLLLLLLGCAAALAAAHDGHYHDTDGDGQEEHDPAHDQEQFLGKDSARQFAGYDARVSKAKLLALVQDKVDVNKDDSVSEEELLQYLEKVHREHQSDELDSHWKELNTQDGKLDWAVHARSLQPSFFDSDRQDEAAKAAAEAIEMARKDGAEMPATVPEKVSEDDREVLLEFYKELARQRKRWVVADVDHDGHLSKEEFGFLLFPEDAPVMRGVVVSETIDQLDSDRDGRLNLEEYLSGQWKPKESGEQEPDWLHEERESFAKKDVNKDGFLDRPEVQLWIQPPGLSSSSSMRDEAKHLVREADDNKDGRLSLEEISNHQELFAGSKATRYGEDVMEGHDEL